MVFPKIKKHNFVHIGLVEPLGRGLGLTSPQTTRFGGDLFLGTPLEAA